MSGDVIERLTRIETKLDAFNKVADDHEVRLRKNENWVGLNTGANSIIAGFLAFIYYKLR